MEHPVIALRGSPGSYPMLGGNRAIQKYFKWEPKFFQEAGTYIKETFQDEGFVGIHLRNGIDWVSKIDFLKLASFILKFQCSILMMVVFRLVFFMTFMKQHLTSTSSRSNF